MKINTIAPGVIAGLTATTPMTMVMDVLHARAHVNPHEPLPPAQVAMEAARQVGLERHMTGKQRDTAALVAHFGFGAAMGGLYGAMARSLPGPPIANGIGFGLGVWAASYMGVLPATGVFPPPTREQPQRTAMMIAAHVVWGAATGFVTHHLAHRTLGRTFRDARPKHQPRSALRHAVTVE